jgi:hypothetical protein
MKKEEIIQQLEARGASKETIDKIKNATEEEAVDLAWKQLGWLERMWGRASWWLVLFLVCPLLWLVANWPWLIGKMTGAFWMNEDQVVLWISIAINLVAFIVLFLKGRWTVIILAIAATLLSPVAIFGTYWHHIITEPLRWWPLIAIFRLAKPSSRWAEWFYNEPKMLLARQRYPAANPVPRSLQKQAMRNLKAMQRGDYSAIEQQIRERNAGTTEPPS